MAQLNARAAVATGVLRESAHLYTPDPTTPASQVVALSPPLKVIWRPSTGSPQKNCIATASRFTGEKTEYWIAKGEVHQWVDAGSVTLSK